MQGAAGIRLSASLQDIETFLTVDAMKALLLELLKDSVNYEPLEALTNVKYLGWHNLIEDGCVLWDTRMYKQVRAFVLENRRRQSLFLNPECCSSLKFLSDQDYSNNLKDNLLCAIPSRVDHNTIKAYIAAMHRIVEIDPQGIWRRRRKLKYYNWNVIFGMHKELLATPLHQYFDFDMIRAARGHECAIINLFADYALLNIDRQDFVAASITAIMTCFFEEDYCLLGNFSDLTKVSEQALTALQSMRDKITKGPLSRILYWLTTTPFDSLAITDLPPIFNTYSNPALIKLGICLAINLDSYDDDELEGVAVHSRRLLPKLPNHEFLQTIYMITRFSHPGKLCKIFANGASARLLRISPDLLGDDADICACFEGKDRIRYFRRWQRKLSSPAYPDSGSGPSGYAIVIDWPNIPPAQMMDMEPSNTLLRLLEACLNDLRSFLYWGEFIDINNSAIEPQMRDRVFNQMLMMLSVFVLLELHYGTAVQLNPRWVFDIVCGTSNHIVTIYLSTQKHLVSGLTIVYGYMDCGES